MYEREDVRRLRAADSQRDGHPAIRFKRAAFYQSLKSKVGLAAEKAAALRINLNVEGCGIVAAPNEPKREDFDISAVCINGHCVSWRCECLGIHCAKEG